MNFDFFFENNEHGKWKEHIPIIPKLFVHLIMLTSMTGLYKTCGWGARGHGFQIQTRTHDFSSFFCLPSFIHNSFPSLRSQGQGRLYCGLLEENDLELYPLFLKIAGKCNLISCAGHMFIAPTSIKRVGKVQLCTSKQQSKMPMMQR